MTYGERKVCQEASHRASGDIGNVWRLMGKLGYGDAAQRLSRIQPSGSRRSGGETHRHIPTIPTSPTVPSSQIHRQTFRRPTTIASVSRTGIAQENQSTRNTCYSRTDAVRVCERAVKVPVLGNTSALAGRWAGKFRGGDGTRAVRRAIHTVFDGELAGAVIEGADRSAHVDTQERREVTWIARRSPAYADAGVHGDHVIAKSK